MAAWREVFDFMVRCAEESGHGFSEDFADELFKQVTGQYRNEIVRMVSPRESKRREIEHLAQRLPTATVSVRLGVSKSWVNRVRKK